MTDSGIVHVATVFRDLERAGTITRTASGSTLIQDLGFVRAHPRLGVAFQIPSTTRPIATIGVNLHPFFANLLPEGARLRAVVRRAKTSEDDLLSLLVAAGPGTVGDVSVGTTDHVPGADGDPVVDVGKLSEIRFRDVFEASVAGEGGAREHHPIPGVQDKVSGGMISMPVTGRRARRRSAFILKIEPADYPGLARNEHFFMTIAPSFGIPTAKVELVHDGLGVPGLLVERFDRVWDAAEKRLRRIHQEDACQLLDRYPADKYAVTLREVSEALSVCAAPIVERARLLRLYAFSYLIGNGDLHGKNVSVRISPRSGLVELTPAYDVLSTLPYGDRRMAIQIDGRDTRIRGSDLVAFASRHGVRERATREILEQLCDLAPTVVSRLDELALPRKKRADLERTIHERRAELADLG